MGLSLCVLKWLDLWSRPLTLGIAQTSLALLSLIRGLVRFVRNVRQLSTFNLHIDAIMTAK